MLSGRTVRRITVICLQVALLAACHDSPTELSAIHYLNLREVSSEISSDRTTLTINLAFENSNPTRILNNVRLDIHQFWKARDIGLGDIDSQDAFDAGWQTVRKLEDPGTNFAWGWWFTDDPPGGYFVIESPNMPIVIEKILPNSREIVPIVIRGIPKLVDGYVAGDLTVNW